MNICKVAIMRRHAARLPSCRSARRPRWPAQLQDEKWQEIYRTNKIRPQSASKAVEMSSDVDRLE
jgi:hypothetical protein